MDFGQTKKIAEEVLLLVRNSKRSEEEVIFAVAYKYNIYPSDVETALGIYRMHEKETYVDVVFTFKVTLVGKVEQEVLESEFYPDVIIDPVKENLEEVFSTLLHTEALNVELI